MQTTDRADYPADVRADYPQRSSRGWAVLTILWIKFLVVIPHAVVLVFLGIAEFIIAFIAQFVVALTGEYPAGMHRFVTGVLRWRTRVAAFVLSITDRYPPFSLQPRDDYPVDVGVEWPERPSRMYAAFTIVVQIAFLITAVAVGRWVAGHPEQVAAWAREDGSFSYRYNLQQWIGSGLFLRQLAAIPHWIVLLFLGIAVVIIWIIAQWVILFVARFPYGMWEIVAGYIRWYARVNAYSLGLIDAYPPFTMRPSRRSARPATDWPPPPPSHGGPGRPAFPPPPPQAGSSPGDRPLSHPDSGQPEPVPPAPPQPPPPPSLPRP